MGGMYSNRITLLIKITILNIFQRHVKFIVKILKKKIKQISNYHNNKKNKNINKEKLEKIKKPLLSYITC
jgi:hypothetical protein